MQPRTAEEGAISKRLFSFTSIERELMVMRNGRTVPPWDIPKEVWQLLMQAAVTAEQVGATEQEKKEGVAGIETSEILTEAHFCQDFPQELHFG